MSRLSSIAVIIVIALAGCGSPPEPLPRGEFKALVLGKTQDEVRRAVGAPASTDEAKGGEGSTWFYYGRTRDPNATRPDNMTAVDFDRKGVCTGVTFF